MPVLERQARDPPDERKYDQRAQHNRSYTVQAEDFLMAAEYGAANG
jgi:hypothetical protein